MGSTLLMTLPPASPLHHTLGGFLATRNGRLLLLAAWGLVVATSLGVRIAQVQSNHLSLQREGARNVALTILAARAWNSQAGAVYVPVTAELQPNPYLHHPKRDLTTTEGQALTMINPAYMTRMISEVLSQGKTLQISLRSLRPLNPVNRADLWETEALHRFEKGAGEISAEVRQEDGGRLFRFMLPVRTEESCLSCHAAQGDRLGDIRGGLSITFPSETDAVHTEILYTVLRHLAIFVLLGGIGYASFGLLGKHWEQERHALEKTRLADKMVSLERLVQRFCEELKPSLQQSMRLAAQNAEDIGVLGRRFSSGPGHGSDEPERMSALQDSVGETLASLQDLMHRLNSLRHASFSLGEETRRLNLAELLTEILQTHAASYRHCAQIEVVCSPQASLNGVPGLFDQIFGILLSNSVEHGFLGGSRQGHIRIATEQLPDGTLLISYADDGVGMSAERLACVFDPFPEPLGPDHKQGLSLYICYSLITFRLGGSIRCDSMVDGGTHFLITLPDTPASLQ